MPQAFRTVGVFFLLLLFGLPGCQSIPSGRAVSVAPDAPSHRSIPLLDETLRLARAADDRGDGPETRRLAITILLDYPGRPELADAQWLLARSYELDHTPDRAMEEYGLFLRNYPDDARREEARRRLDVLMPRPPPADEQARTATPSVRTAVQLVLFPVRPADFSSLFHTFAGQGINTVIIKGFQNRQDPPYLAARTAPAGAGAVVKEIGVYFRTPQAPQLDDLVSPAVAAAHEQSLSLFVWMPWRTLDWVVSQHPEWQDWRYDPNTNTLRPSGRVDLWNPAVEDYLVELFTDLASSGIDGMLFGEDLFTGEFDGFGPAARRAFATTFQLEPTPAQLWARAPGPMDSSVPPGMVVERRPLFWRWAGWKGRSAGEQLSAMIGRIRERFPAVVVAQNIMADAVVSPSEGLARWGTDVLALTGTDGERGAMRARTIDYLAVLTYPRSALDPSALDDLVHRAAALTGSLARVMVKVPLIDWSTGQPLSAQVVDQWIAAVGDRDQSSVVWLYNSLRIPVDRLPHRQNQNGDDAGAGHP